MDLIVNKVGTKLTIETKPENEEIFSRLVIKSGYGIVLTYTNMKLDGAKYETIFSFDITGDAATTEGAGNGPYVLGNTRFSDTSITLIAG